MELELTRRDGRRITVLESAYAVRGARGGVLHYQGTLTDITERTAAERDLMRARDKALEASRLKPEFLGNMSHEVRTPRNAVVGMASLLVEGPLEEEEGMLGSRASAGHVELICDIHADVPERVAADMRGSLACGQEEAGVCPAPRGKCLRLPPFAQNPGCAGAHWSPALAVSKPVRQLDLLETLMRLFEPAREDTSRALLPLSRQLGAADNRINQQVITRQIERLGHTAHVVNNGSEVLAAAEEEAFDQVLMDCQMPEMDDLAMVLGRWCARSRTPGEERPVDAYPVIE